MSQSSRLKQSYKLLSRLSVRDKEISRALPGSGFFLRERSLWVRLSVLIKSILNIVDTSDEVSFMFPLSRTAFVFLLGV